MSSFHLCRVFDRKEFFRQNYERELFSFKSRLGLKFKDKNLLVTAFTHESYKDDYINDNDDEDSDTIQTRENNAKLSLLGEWICLDRRPQHFSCFLFDLLFLTW